MAFTISFEVRISKALSKSSSISGSFFLESVLVISTLGFDGSNCDALSSTDLFSVLELHPTINNVHINRSIINFLAFIISLLVTILYHKFQSPILLVFWKYISLGDGENKKICRSR